jgi:hypothetical protein
MKLMAVNTTHLRHENSVKKMYKNFLAACHVRATDLNFGKRRRQMHHKINDAKASPGRFKVNNTTNIKT